MRKMKDSGIEWIGEIPEDWEIIKNKYLLSNMYSGGTPTANKPELYSDKGTPFVSIGDMSETDYVCDTKKKLSDLGVKEKNLKILPIGTIVYSIYATIGAVSELKIQATISQALLALSINNQVIKCWYKYNLNAMRDYISFSANGNTQFNLNAEKVWNFSFVIPPIDTQHRIADFLDDKCGKIDRYIEKQHQIIDKLKEYKQAVITEAVTKGLNPDVPMKDSGIEWIGMIPEHWEVKKIKYATEIMRGKFNHRPRNDPDYYDGPYPFIQTGDVARATKYITEYSQTLNQKGYEVSKEFPPESVVMTIAANVADVSILNFKACFPDSIVGFVPKDIDKFFLFYSLKAMRQQLLRNAIISTQLNLNIEIIKEEFIVIPKNDEQIQIVDFLESKCSEIDSAISKQTSIIEKLTEYKKSLIYEAVTGKLEV